MARPEGATIREAVAVFDDPAKLEAAVSDLQSCGFDRADISFLAEHAVGGQVADTRQAEDDARAPRDAGFTDTDVRQRRVFGTSMAATIAAFAAAGFTVMSGGALAVAAGAAAATIAGVGAAGAYFGKGLEEKQHNYLREQVDRGGVLLWIRTKDAAAEQRACDVLRRHSAHDVHVHEVPA
jgi:hypothetical protein